MRFNKKYFFPFRNTLQTVMVVSAKILLFPASLFTTGISFSQPVVVTDRIKLNQLGYYPFAPKVAVLTGASEAKMFFITSTNTRDTLFKGTLSNENQSRNSSTKTRIADFSS